MAMAAGQNDQNETARSGLSRSRRRFADLLLFGVTSTELAILLILTPSFTLTDWIYVLQHIMVLGIALTRGAPKVVDRSLSSSAAVVVAYVYPYAQLIYLRRVPGEPAWPEAGFILVTFAAVLSFARMTGQDWNACSALSTWSSMKAIPSQRIRC